MSDFKFSGLPNNRLPNCAFCGIKLTRSNRTREHLWPDWMKAYTGPRSATAQSGHVTSISKPIYEAGQLVRIVQQTRSGILDRPGHVMSQKIGIVCGPCNSGWMSQIQTSVKPMLIPFLRGEWQPIEPNNVLLLSRWIAMFVMVREFVHIETMATTQRMRQDFRKNLQVPPDWFFWVGSHSGTLWEGAFNHFGSKLSLTDSATSSPSNPAAFIGCDAFTVGRLFVQTYRVRGILVDTIPDELAEDFADANGLRCLWPQPVSCTAILKPDRMLNDYEADSISRSFLDPIHRRAARPVWSPV